VTVPGLQRTTSLCFVLRCARDTFLSLAPMRSRGDDKLMVGSAYHSGPAYFPAVAGNIDLTIFIFEMSTVASMCKKMAASR
jgi:hypothetical protein